VGPAGELHIPPGHKKRTHRGSSSFGEPPTRRSTSELLTYIYIYIFLYISVHRWAAQITATTSVGRWAG